ncbi:hypothetical protein BT69DRAFT_1289648 [Atractiella rhizophila]|nr:hypothetical protein BT69DRAFT_1289648 [Atractiella rhizophila]
MEREKNMFDIDFESLYGELGKGSGDRNGMGVNGDFGTSALLCIHQLWLTQTMIRSIC